MTDEFAGTLSERVSVWRSPGRNAAGAALAESEQAKAWAAVSPQQAGIDVRGGRQGTFGRWTLLMRVGDAPLVGDGLRWRTARLRVLSVTRDPRVADRVRVLAEARA